MKAAAASAMSRIQAVLLLALPARPTGMLGQWMARTRGYALEERPATEADEKGEGHPDWVRTRADRRRVRGMLGLARGDHISVRPVGRFRRMQDIRLIPLGSVARTPRFLTLALVGDVRRVRVSSVAQFKDVRVQSTGPRTISLGDPRAAVDGLEGTTAHVTAPRCSPAPGPTGIACEWAPTRDSPGASATPGNTVS